MDRLRLKLHRLLARALYGSDYKIAELQLRTVDMDPEFWVVWERVAAFTMTPAVRAYAMYQAVQHIERNQLPGAIVECGVWRGGSAMIAALMTQARQLYLYDTFEGMPAPTAADVTWRGEAGVRKWRQRHNGARSEWACAGIDEVRRNLASTGYPAERLHLVQGRVEEMIPGIVPERIALLRLDTDFYESTLHELRHLYPRLCTGGVLIVDDYGHWQGARRAVDEYFEQMRIAPMLNRIDYSGRISIKP